MNLDRKNSGLGQNGKATRKRERSNQLAESDEGDCPSKKRRFSSHELNNSARQEEDRGKENGNASLPLPRPRPLPFPLLLLLSLSLSTPTSLPAPSTTRTRSNSRAETSQDAKVKPAIETISDEDEEEDDIDEVNVRSSGAPLRSERWPSSSQTQVESICSDDAEESGIFRNGGQQPNPKMGDVSAPSTPAPITSRSSSESVLTVSSTSPSPKSNLDARVQSQVVNSISNDFSCHTEEDTPHILLTQQSHNQPRYKTTDEFEVDLIADYDKETDEYLVIWKGWSLCAMSRVRPADLNSPDLLKMYGEYARAASAIEKRLATEGSSHKRIFWRAINTYSGRCALFENKLREARFNLLLHDTGIAPVFVENWLATLRKRPNFGELPSFKFIYKSFMLGRLRREFLAMPRGFNKSRCRCENGVEDCSGSNLDCCANNVSTDSNHIRLFYDMAKRLILPVEMQTVNYELIECSGSCKCGPGCPNRITQRGRQVAVVIFFENTEKNWGLRAGEPIRRGQFITEYVGEVKLASSLKYSNKAYQLQIPRTLEFDDKSESLVIDASGFGNEARFINHSCSPNALLVWVYSDDYGSHYARSCFFATRDIQAGEEIMYNYYGAALKKKVKSGIKCRCSFKCNIYIPDQTEQRSDAQATLSSEQVERSQGEANRRKSMTSFSRNSSSSNGNNIQS